MRKCFPASSETFSTSPALQIFALIKTVLKQDQYIVTSILTDQYIVYSHVDIAFLYFVQNLIYIILTDIYQEFQVDLRQLLSQIQHCFHLHQQPCTAQVKLLILYPCFKSATNQTYQEPGVIQARSNLRLSDAALDNSYILKFVLSKAM